MDRENCPVPVRSGDEEYCTKCKARWDARETATECFDPAAVRPRKRFLIFGGEVRSEYDGQRHNIPLKQIVRLYGIEESDCEFWAPGMKESAFADLLPLGPLPGGDYKEHLQRIKLENFHNYVEAKKRLDHHLKHSSRGAVAEAERRIALLEHRWPEFVGAYKVMLGAKVVKPTTGTGA